MIFVAFDIDGTLTDTNAVDAQRFAESLRRNLPISDFNSNWETYENETDTGIASELALNVLQRDITSEELGRIEHTFHGLLKQDFARDSTCCQPILGAAEIIQALQADDSIALGFATAGWRQTALLKLTHAGIEIRDSILKSATEHHRKIDAMRSVASETLVRYRLAAFESEVYIGDSWRDYRFATELKMKFIGIGTTFENHMNLDFPAFSDFKRADAILRICKSAEPDWGSVIRTGCPLAAG